MVNDTEGWVLQKHVSLKQGSSTLSDEYLIADQTEHVQIRGSSVCCILNVLFYITTALGSDGITTPPPCSFPRLSFEPISIVLRINVFKTATYDISKKYLCILPQIVRHIIKELYKCL